jgi:putative heme-binding domain-containing protein
MTFNLPQIAGGATFGPSRWRGDALVTGESRGKLYRTRLVRDANGEYVASNQLIACLKMLTVDCCLTPRGDLLVACHSGGPDWGTGPEGKGKLFQIRYERSELPQIVNVWTRSPHEVRIAFDRPLDPSGWKSLASQIKITYGEYVGAGDRFESIRPGYAVTQLQQATPRFRLPVYSSGITPDRQTLILSTAQHRFATQYALTLPGFGQSDEKDPGDVLPQRDEIDLAYSLGGVLATWTPDDGIPEDGIPHDGASADRTSQWTLWLPHLDLDVSSALLDPQSAAQLREILQRPGTLKMKTQVDTRGLFAPAVQPGSQLDYDINTDPFVIRRSVVISLQHAGAPDTEPLAQEFGPRDQPRPIELNLKTGRGQTAVHVEWKVECRDGNGYSGSLALHRFILPWAETQRVSAAESSRQIPQLAGASWGRGRRVFLSDEAGCSKCHLASGFGGNIGPDLSNLVHRDYDSVLRDITDPSYAINPDYITYSGLLNDGRVLTGAVRSEADDLLFGDKDGKVTRVRRDDIDQLRPSTVSIMPESIAKSLGEAKMNDLLAFLMMPAPRMPHDSPLSPPPPRTRREVSEVLRGSVDVAGEPKPRNILLVAGKKDHGPGEHDYPAWMRVWSELLGSEPGITVDTAMEWPSDGQIDVADTIVFFQKGSWTDQRAGAIDAHLAKGRGLVYIHWAVEGGERAPEFAKRIGLASDASKLKYRHGPLELGFQTGSSHPIGRNFDSVHFHDESYWLMQGDRARIDVIGTGIEDDQPRPLFWTLEPSGGRVFVSIPGHYSWTFDDPMFRILLLRGIAWTASESVDRFNALATLGVDLVD